MDQPAYTLSTQELFKKFNTKESGLTGNEAEANLKSYGLNQLTPKKKISLFSLYLEQFKNTLTLILIGSTFLILFIYFFGEHDSSDLIEAGLILAIILMITILGFVQEFKAEKAIESLKKLLAYKAKVLRDNKEQEIDVKDLVPGDIVILEEGAKVPADLRLIKVFDLNVNEASLTGESTSVRKSIDPISGQKQIADQKNMVFSATIITSGRGIGVVVKTGDSTEIGKIAKDVAEAVEDQTPIQKKLDEIGKTIGYVIVGICSVVFIFIVFFAKDFTSLPLLNRIIQSFIAAVALAVAAIPEGLPAVVTIALSFGTQRMLKKNALVRRLNSVETLGSTDVICSDKTGTLTRGEMTVRVIYIDGKQYDVSGVGFDTQGEFSLSGKNIDLNAIKKILEIGLLCNNAVINEKSQIGDPTEIALLVSAKKAHIDTKLERLDEIPFSSERKLMSVVLKEKNDYFVYTKGATEIILNHCSAFVKDGKEIQLSEKEKQNIIATNEMLSEKALRNLGFAYKKLSETEYKKQSKDEKSLEEDLIFVGIQGMIDPPRPEVKPLIAKLTTAGIRVIMITGDHIQTAKAVALEIGIQGEAYTGEQLDKINDEEFLKLVENISIYARVNPGVKMRIVDALKKKNHIVAMTGDGVNDAPALKRADIGIAMGITGTDVAKEASDMILLDDNFGTIVSAIEEGRAIFHNIRKFVNYLLSCNIGEILVVFLGVMIFQKLPLTATMLLWINVVTDGLPAVALGVDPAEKNIMSYKPQVFQKQIVPVRLWVDMFVYGVLITLAVLGIFAINLKDGLPHAQGAAFTAIVMFELIRLYIIRSDFKTSFFSNLWLFWAVLVSVIIQIAIVYTPFISNLFEVEYTNLFDWGYILVGCATLWIFFKIIRRSLNTVSHLS